MFWMSHGQFDSLVSSGAIRAGFFSLRVRLRTNSIPRQVCSSWASGRQDLQKTPNMRSWNSRRVVRLVNHVSLRASLGFSSLCQQWATICRLQCRDFDILGCTARAQVGGGLSSRTSRSCSQVRRLCQAVGSCGRAELAAIAGTRASPRSLPTSASTTSSCFGPNQAEADAEDDDATAVSRCGPAAAQS